MGHGYMWASMLKTSAYFGLGMSVLMLVLFGFIYYKRRKSGVILVTASVLSAILLMGSSYLLYQASYSKERIALNHVDFQVMYIVDLNRRIQFLLRTLPRYQGIDDEQIKHTLDLARDYLREIEQSVDGIEELEFLNSVFQVGEKKNLSTAASIGYFFGGRLGLLLTAIIAFLTSAYMVLRYYLDPKDATNVGWLLTAAVFIAFAFITSHDKYGSFNPVIVTLLFVAFIVAVLHYCIHNFSVLFLEITTSVFLVLSVGLFTVSSWSILIYGEDKILEKLKAINARSPMIVSRAQGLGISLDDLLEMNRFDAGWDNDLIGLTNPIDISIGALEESLGNLDTQSPDPAEWHLFDPYKDEYELFEKEYKRLLSGN